MLRWLIFIVFPIDDTKFNLVYILNQFALKVVCKNHLCHLMDVYIIKINKPIPNYENPMLLRFQYEKRSFISKSKFYAWIFCLRVVKIRIFHLYLYHVLFLLLLICCKLHWFKYAQKIPPQIIKRISLKTLIFRKKERMK